MAFTNGCGQTGRDRSELDEFVLFGTPLSFILTGTLIGCVGFRSSFRSFSRCWILSSKDCMYSSICLLRMFLG